MHEKFVLCVELQPVKSGRRVAIELNVNSHLL